MNKYLIGFGIVYLLISEATATATFEVPATGEHAFGPNETQTRACEMAASKAKKNALVKHFGELVGRETLLTCDSFVQIATGSDCDLFESSWSLINSNGFIKGTKNFQQAARFSESQRTNVCKVDAIFIIEEFAGKADTSFQSSADLSLGLTLRVGDKPQINIQSNKVAYHYVFHWAPLNDRENYYRIFPNSVDIQLEPTEKLTIPSSRAKQSYELNVSLPIGVNRSSEYLILLSFKTPVDDVPKTISRSGFFAWLKSFERNQWTQDKISYRIIGDST